jgi:hypothetical protein
MQKLKLEKVKKYVEDNIGVFHERKLKSLIGLQLHKILARKNPYLFKAKNVLTAEQIVRGILDAHLSSNEEAIFGDWLEGLAIFINNEVFGGKKSGISGIDLEFDKDMVRYIVAIKSGPNWGNSSQIKKMISDFNSARKALRTSNSKINIIAVNGCCYGKDRKPEKNGNYFKYCGQEFWEFISGDGELYTKIIEPLGHKAKEKNEDYLISYARNINNFTLEFAKQFCKSNGDIDWEKLVIFNSAKK